MPPHSATIGTAPETTFRVGGAPDGLITFTSAAEYMAEHAELGPHRIIGGGSNLVVSDRGPSGAIAVLSSPRSGVIDVDGPRVRVDTAGRWHDTAVQLGAAEMAGVESLVGIPGTVGGAIVQNIGAYGQEICEVVERVKVLSIDDGSSMWLTGDECRFGYRDSRFKSADRGRFVVLEAELRLACGGRHRPRYAELARELERRSPPGNASRPTSPERSASGHSASERSSEGYGLEEVHEAVLALRSGKNMVWRDDDRRTWGAGSFFVNPTIDDGGLAVLTDRLGEAPPSWPVPVAQHAPGADRGTDDRDRTSDPHHDVGKDGVHQDGVHEAGVHEAGVHKISAGWLVERAGFLRGHRWNSVGLAPGHALGLVNITGWATAADVIDAANEMGRAVTALSGLRLLAEPIFLGFDAEMRLDFDAHIEP